MFHLISAVRFIQPMKAGRTKPVLISCERASGEEIDVVAKFSAAGCTPAGIGREALMSMLAMDLGLPVPEPFFVKVDTDFVNALPSDQVAVAATVRASIVPTFGSALLPPGYSVWTAERMLSQEQVEPAAEIFAFDALTLNPDRRVSNPNCLSSGQRFAIFDHELALMAEVVGTRLQPGPWVLNGLDPLLQGDGEHVLYRGLKARSARIDRLEAAWNGLTVQRLSEYVDAIPTGWHEAMPAVTMAVEYLQNLKSRLVPAFAEVRRVLA